ncbi:hypothetical protein [Salinibaculum marinum]
MIEGVYIAVVPPVSGYETSIYEPYPLTFWIALFLSIALIVVVLLTASVSSRSFYGRALILLAANYGILLFLPTFRGYQLHDNANGDILVHLGHIRTIVVEGNVPDLWYPFEHVLMAVFAVFGVPLEESSMLFTLVFLLIFVTTAGVFLRSVLRRNFALAAGTAAATPLLMASFTVSAQPSIFSVFLLPILLTFSYRFRRTLDKRYFFLLCLILFAIILFHPVTSLFVIGILCSTWLFGQVYEWLTGHRIPTPDWNLALAMIPLLFIWYTGFDKTWFMLNKKLKTLTGATASPVGATTEETVLLTFEQIMIRFVQLYGAVFIYLIIAAIVTLVVIFRISRGSVTFPGMYLSLLFVMGFFSALTLLISPIESFAPIRSSRFLIVMAVLLVSTALVSATYTDYQRSLTVIITGAIIVAIALSVAIVYQPNIHMTKSEFEGAKYVNEYHASSASVYNVRMTDNMEDYLHSVPRSEIETYHFGGLGKKLPHRLGYTKNNTAAETFGNAFLVTKEADTKFYEASYFFPDQQESLFIFNESDKAKLHDDVTVNKLYENGGFEGWRVNTPT